MGINRLIEEKYWSQFITTDLETEKTKHDGHRFEDLIECLLRLMYPNFEWEPTKMTHDGNKDFKAQVEEDVYWAECKNYKNKIDLKTIAATLVMAEIENVNSVFFFCYSEINSNTKTKLNSFSRSNHKRVFFYDGIVLDQLIMKYQEDILPEYFPDLYERIEDLDISANIPSPIALCYLERNPFFNGTSEFDMQNLTELQDLKLGEVIGIHIVIINTNLDSPAHCSIEMTFQKSEQYFEILTDKKYVKKNKILFRDMELPAGATIRKTFYLKLCRWASQVNLPKIKCKLGQKKIGEFYFSSISTLKTRQTAFLGSNYIEKVDYLCKGCLNQQSLSVIYVYGSSGTGKSRMIAECTAKFVKQGYRIIKLINSEHSEHSTFIMLKELIFSLYGFSDEIIELIINNEYEALQNYKNNTYKEIFKIIRSIYENRYTLSQIGNWEYSVIFEKMAKGKYFIVVDDIQNWDEQAITFIKSFYQYAISMHRKCNTVIGIVANTDLLYNQKTMEFLAELLSKNNHYEINIFPYNLTGFETANQSYLFLKELLGIEDNFYEIEELNNISLKPKYLTEVANYLQDCGAIKIVNNIAVIANKHHFRELIHRIPRTIQTILEKRWSLYLQNALCDETVYKQIISSLLFLGRTSILNDLFGQLHKAEIERLFQYGFLKKEESKDDIFIFEHDSIKIYFKEHYIDWFKTAVFYLKDSDHNFLKGKKLEKICDLYADVGITQDTYYRFLQDDYSDEIKDNIYERILYLALNHETKGFYNLICTLFQRIREEFGEKRAEKFYEIFEEQYVFSSHWLSCEEYCNIMMDYAENQLKLKSTEKSIQIYDLILNKIEKEPFPQKDRLSAKLGNRYFVCGRVGNFIQQYSEKWSVSMKLASKNSYHDVCIENYFDKAHSLFLDNTSFEEAKDCLKKGCNLYNAHQPLGLRGQYLYRDIQLSFFERDYAKLRENIWKYEEEIFDDKVILFKLYFRIQFLIFKIVLCLLGEKEYSDFEMKNMLEQLNMFQAMQNSVQLYRYFYLCGKYYTKKGEWEKAYLLYQKTFDNLTQNKATEEICLQRNFIAQDMIINFKTKKFPFDNYDMSMIEPIVKGTDFENVRFLTDKEFSVFFNEYKPLAPIINEQTKEGFLLF